MSREEQELARLRVLSPEASLIVDGGVRAVFLPAFKFLVGGISRTMDLLLYPGPHSSYDTRLFFREKIALTRADGSTPNWQEVVVAGSNWHAVSWSGVSAQLPWPEMLTAHLRALV